MKLNECINKNQYFVKINNIYFVNYQDSNYYNSKKVSKIYDGRRLVYTP